MKRHYVRADAEDSESPNAVVIISCIHSLECSVGRLTIPIVQGVLLDQVTRGTCRNFSHYFDTMHQEFPTAVSIRIID